MWDSSQQSSTGSNDQFLLFVAKCIHSFVFCYGIWKLENSMGTCWDYKPKYAHLMIWFYEACTYRITNATEIRYKSIMISFNLFELFIAWIIFSCCFSCIIFLVRRLCFIVLIFWLRQLVQSQASCALGQVCHCCNEWSTCKQSLSTRICYWRHSCCQWPGEESGTNLW